MIYNTVYNIIHNLYDTQSVLTPGHLQLVISTQEIYELKQMHQITSLQSSHLKMMPNVVPKLGNLCWWWCHPVAKFASIKCRLLSLCWDFHCLKGNENPNTEIWNQIEQLVHLLPYAIYMLMCPGNGLPCNHDHIIL